MPKNKKTIIQKYSKKIWEDVKPYLRYGYSFDQSTEIDSQLLPSSLKGLYLFVEKGKSPKKLKNIVYYVGETYSKSKYSGINARVKSHQKSLKDPEYEQELTGKKFKTYGIPLDISMDLWYISSDISKIGLDDKTAHALLEAALQKHLKPKVWDIK